MNGKTIYTLKMETVGLTQNMFETVDVELVGDMMSAILDFQLRHDVGDTGMKAQLVTSNGRVYHMMGRNSWIYSNKAAGSRVEELGEVG